MGRRSRPVFPPRWLWSGLLVALAVAGGQAAATEDEIAMFRVTGVDGYVTLRHLNDESTTTQAGPTGSTQSTLAQSEWRSEVFLTAHSYMYHPNFMTLDLGGGPVLQDGELATDAGSSSSHATLYNLVGRARFLPGKAINGSLFYEHLNPVLSLTPGEVLNQETTRSGAELATTSALMPIPLRVEFTRTQASGRNAERVLDDRLDQWNLRLTRTFGTQGATQLQYQASEQQSLSGSANLPIQSTATESQGLDLDTRLQFGAAGQHELTNLVSANKRRYAIGSAALPEQADLNLLIDLQLRPGTAVSSYGNYHYGYNDNGERTSATQALAAGVGWSPDEDAELSFGGRGEANRASSFSLDAREVSAALHIQAALPLGKLQATLAGRLEHRKQNAQAMATSVIGEHLALVGTTPATLAQARVVAASVVVSNSSRSQTYVENIDYALTTVGDRTRLQRLVGGNILDGEEVLVDYTYELGGTFGYAQDEQTLNLNWAASRQLNVYLREHHSSAKVTSGTPTFPLNNVRSRLYGLRADVPLRLGVAMTGGCSVEREQVSDALAPLRRASTDLYLQTEEPLFELANLGVTLRRMRLDYVNSPHDTDLRGYSLRLSTRGFGADLSAVRNYEADRGGATVHRRWNDLVDAQWRERKLTLTARLARGRETQGSFERKHSLFQLALRRDF